MNKLVFLVEHLDDLLIELKMAQLQHQQQIGQVQENAYKFHSKQKQQSF